MIEDPAFSLSFYLAPSPSTPNYRFPSASCLSLPVCCSSSLLAEEGGGRGGGRSRIIRRQVNLVLYNPLTTLLYRLSWLTQELFKCARNVRWIATTLWRQYKTCTVFLKSQQHDLASKYQTHIPKTNFIILCGLFYQWGRRLGVGTDQRHAQTTTCKGG